jgi:flagellar motor switch protein FliN/FliY
MTQSDIDALAAAGQRSPDLAELGNGVTNNSEVPLAMLMDLTLPLSIELGRTRMTVQDILRLGRGSVVQLERLAGEPIDLYVADRRFAEGRSRRARRAFRCAYHAHHLRVWPFPEGNA